MFMSLIELTACLKSLKNGILGAFTRKLSCLLCFLLHKTVDSEDNRKEKSADISIANLWLATVNTFFYNEWKDVNTAIAGQYSPIQKQK